MNAFSFFLWWVIAVSWAAPGSESLAASGLARVTGDLLPVSSANSQEGEVVGTLKRGDWVRVRMAVFGSNSEWCLVSGEEGGRNLGFVSCRGLEFVEKEAEKPRQPEAMEAWARPPIEDPAGEKRSGSKIRGEEEGNRKEDPWRDPISPISQGVFLQALWREDLAAVRDLLEKGADPNARTFLGARPLLIAAKKGRKELVDLLIARGAEVNARGQKGETALISASSAGHFEIVRLLLEGGAEVDARDDQSLTALMWGAIQGYPDVVHILLEKGAEVNQRSNQGKTALWFSAQAMANLRRSLANSSKADSRESESDLRVRLENHGGVDQLLREAGGRE